MFNNVGKKIKGVALTVFVILLIVSVILAYLISSEFFSKNDTKSVLWGILVFVLIVTVGALISWLIVLMTYAFGELVDANQIQVKQNNAIIQMLGGQGYSSESESESEEPTIKKYHDEKYKRNYANNAFGAIDLPSNDEQGGTDQ